MAKTKINWADDAHEAQAALWRATLLPSSA
jgi:hypothetical protein